MIDLAPLIMEHIAQIITSAFFAGTIYAAIRGDIKNLKSQMENQKEINEQMMDNLKSITDKLFELAKGRK